MLSYKFRGIQLVALASALLLGGTALTWYALIEARSLTLLFAAWSVAGAAMGMIYPVVSMLAMARALMSEPKVLLLDEPSMGLAPLLVREIFNVIGRLKAQGIPILLVEQNAHAALSIADHGYVLETGTIALHGPAATLLADERVKSAYLGL